MRVVRTVVVLGLVALAVSACGGSSHVRYSTFSRVGELSVPTPPGFRRRSWSGGVTISNRAIGLGSLAGPLTSGYLPERPNRVALSVYRLSEMSPGMLARHIHLPLTLTQLLRASRQPVGVLSGGAFVFQKKVSGFHTDAYGVQVWLGGSASTADRSAVLRALNAIEPG